MIKVSLVEELPVEGDELTPSMIKVSPVEKLLVEGNELTLLPL